MMIPNRPATVSGMVMRALVASEDILSFIISKMLRFFKKRRFCKNIIIKANSSMIMV